MAFRYIFPLAKLLLFGVLDEKTQQVKGAIELPGLLSFLADSVKTKVQGLSDFKNFTHPPTYRPLF